MWVQASTLQLKGALTRECQERLNMDPEDEWSIRVIGRVQSCIDLVAVNARYHPTCRLLFKTHRSLVSVSSPIKRKGRRVNRSQMKAFLFACNWLENETTVHSLKEFRAKVQEYLGDTKASREQLLKILLSQHYKSHIVFSNESTRATLLYLVGMAKYIIDNGRKQRSENISIETNNILRSAALLIKTDIRDKEYSNEYYPSSQEVTEKWIPPSLRQFLSHFTQSELKQESVGQTIVKLSAPSQNPPILFALTVEMDNLYGSRWLIDELFKLGFCSSYGELTRFKQATVCNKSNALELPSDPGNPSFTQFVADNVDHNIATLNGEGTFHGMGIIASTVVQGSFKATGLKLKRPVRRMKIGEMMSMSSAVQSFP